MILLDFTRRVEAGVPVYPGDPPAAVESYADFETDDYHVSRLELGTHAGTYADASAHTEPDDVTPDDFPADDPRFTAYAIDC